MSYGSETKEPELVTYRMSISVNEDTLDKLTWDILLPIRKDCHATLGLNVKAISVSDTT